MHWGMLLIGIAFFYLPWIGTAFKQLTTWPRSGESVPLGDALSQILRLLALGPATKVEANSLWMAIFLLLLILGLWPWVRANGRRAHWLSWGLPLLWLAAPVAMVLVGGLYKEAYLKFLLVAVAPFCILMGRGVTGFMEALQHGAWWKPGQRMRATNGRPPATNTRGTANRNNKTRRQASVSANAAPAATVTNPVGKWLAWAWLVTAVVLVSIPTAMTLRTYYFDPSVARDDYRSMARYIQAVGRPEDAILLNAPGQREVFEYYYDGDLPIYALPEQRPPDAAATTAQVKEIAASHPHLYSLFWATGESDPDGVVEGWLDTHAYKAADSWKGDVRFVIYATQQPTSNWPVQPMDVLLGDQIRLTGSALSSQEVDFGDVLQLQLNWQAERTPDADYTVFVQLLDERDQVIAQHDAPPVSGERPTSGWQPGEQVSDKHGLLVPAGTAPGDYRLIAGMYDPQSGKRLPVDCRRHHRPRRGTRQPALDAAADRGARHAEPGRLQVR